MDGYPAKRDWKRECKELEAENARLREELKVLYATNNNHVEVRVKLREELAAAQADAERYRWLRDTQEGKTVRIMDRREWDNAIDDAMKKEQS